ncbi:MULTISPECIES: hypothetical protein [unclassified Bradyrhizobium]|uniref:hypothetical protein n=1 Tax=unclassified Bradyrhizobium TaxID=2631580 RepID=UPI002916703D|nr:MULTISPECIES: hypothetical protein [unclassified Bradyrhizobium]
MLSAIAVLLATVSLCIVMIGLFGWGPPSAGHGTAGQAAVRIVLVLVGVAALIGAAALFAVGRPAHARDLGQWGEVDPGLRAPPEMSERAHSSSWPGLTRPSIDPRRPEAGIKQGEDR